MIELHLGAGDGIGLIARSLFEHAWTILSSCLAG
jgi:hypothetical protein